MLEDRLQCKRACAKLLSFGSVFQRILLLGFLVGCNRSGEDLNAIYANLESPGNWSQPQQESELTQAASTINQDQQVQPTGFDPQAEPRVATLMPLGEMDVEEIKEKFWAFPSDEQELNAKSLQLTRLPDVTSLEEDFLEPIGVLLTPEAVTHDQFEDNSASDESTAVTQAGPRLADPEDVVAAEVESVEPQLTEEMKVTREPVESVAVAVRQDRVSSSNPVLVEQESTPSVEISPEEERLLRAVIREASQAATGVLTDMQLNEQAKTKIREAYSLANRRAHYAARQKLIEVIRMISQAKDAQRGVSQGTLALAAGLRALDEAEDFAPKGTQLEAELNLEVLTAAHRTPIAQQIILDKMLPQQMMTLYYRYAQLKLALAVAGEPSGSMALHTLGKIQGQLWKLEPERHRLARRRAIAYQQAALLAHPHNYLAAHELGVLLAGSGHLAEAEQLFLEVASRQPNAVVYQNLAKVQEDLGQTRQAAATRAQATQSVSGRRQVQWISPDEFARIGDAHPAPNSLAQNLPATNPSQSRPPQRQQPPRSFPGWR